MVGASLERSLSVLYPAANPVRDFRVADVGGVETLIEWNEALGARPSDAAIAELLKTPLIPPSAVDHERDRRMATMPFGGRLYQFDEESRVNIMEAGALALAAIIAGAQVGDFRWASPDNDFAWLAMDNTRVVMDAQTMMAFAQAAASWKREHIYAARVIKDQTPIPADYSSDARWPD